MNETAGWSVWQGLKLILAGICLRNRPAKQAVRYSE